MKNEKIKRVLAFSLAVSMMLFSFSGCSSKGRNEAKEELNITLEGEPLTIDPQLCYDTTSVSIIMPTIGTLYVYDENRRLVPWLAESCDISEDGLTYTYHLRDNLKWSDGRPLTASDYVYGLQRLVDPEVGSGSVYFATDCCTIKNAREINMGEMSVENLGVSAPDDRTFVVELENACPYFNSLVTDPSFSPCNKEFFESCNGNYATGLDTVISSGPYIIDSYEPLPAQMHYSLNPYFFDKDSIQLESMNIQVVSNMQQALMCYETGTLDITPVAGEIVELAEGDDNLVEFSSASLNYIFINHKIEDLANVNIRRALSKSIDRESIVENYLRVGNSPMTRINPKGYYMETDGTDFAEDQSLYDEYTAYDPVAAKELWEKGLSEIGKKEVTLSIAFSSNLQGLVEIIAQDMEKMLPGLTVEMIPLSKKDWLTAPQSGKYDMVMKGWSADYADPTTFYNEFISGAYDEYGYTNPDYDELLKRCATEFANDPDGRNALLHEAEEVLMEDVAAIPIFSSGRAYMVDDSVSGFMLNPTGAGFNVTCLKKEKK